jgi:site-specific recombinase XerD
MNTLPVQAVHTLTHGKTSTLDMWLSRLPINTARAYRKDIEDFAVFLRNDVDRVNEYAPLELYKIGADYVNSLTGKSTATISRKISAVRSYLDFLCQIGTLKDNPLKHVRTPKIHNRTRDTLTAEDTVKILSSVDRSTITGKRDFAILLILTQLGMRRSEVANLKFSNVQTANERTFLKFIGKGDKTRMLPLSRGIISAMEDYFNTAGTDSRSGEQPLFPNPDGRHLSENSIYNIVLKYTDLGDVEKKLSPHTFRHFAITEAVKVEDSIMKVKEFSGHASTNTLARYTHLNTLEVIDDIQHKRGIE